MWSAASAAASKARPCCRKNKQGEVFRSSEQIKKDYPELPACETYDELLALIRGAL